MNCKALYNGSTICITPGLNSELLNFFFCAKSIVVLYSAVLHEHNQSIMEAWKLD